jgi:4-amino-4-deoxy-L-arabinose transferase-like glycosyltransferase
MAQDNKPQNEPTVLDYVKSKLMFWQKKQIEIPGPESAPETESSPPLSIGGPPDLAVPSQPFILPWRSLLAIALALGAQRAFEPPRENPDQAAWVGLCLYFLAIAMLLWAWRRNEWALVTPPASTPRIDTHRVRLVPLVISLLLLLVAFFTFANNLFTLFNLSLLVLGLLFFIWAFWEGRIDLRGLWQRLSDFLKHDEWQVKVTRWGLLVLAAVAIAVFYRVYRLDQVPNEPFSDHAEKILDVYDVVNGETHIFFPRNTGREAIQMYLTAAVAYLFGTGLSFMSLKIGTVALGILTLPYMYLLGKEIGNRRVGLLALFLTGIAYWPNVISRIGLRFPLYPVFTAPALYYLFRGLRTSKRNDFIWSGLFLGLGLHGYSPFRLVPVILVMAVVVYLLHSQSRGQRMQAIWWLGLVALVSVIVFLPLLRYITEDPANAEIFFYRSITRLGSEEQPLPGPVGQVFLSNLWNGIKMLNWDDGQIWVHSVTYRPALDVVSGALFILGAVLMLVRYIRQRHWLDLFLLISIPLLMMPSILSLSFPDENPALNRASAAFIPVFLIAALALDGLLTGIASVMKGRGGTVLVVGVTGLLMAWSMAQNYNLVFDQFYKQYKSGAWNTSEMGAVIRQFGDTFGSTDNTWIVPYPYWVDTRLPGVWAGIPNRDFALWPENFNDTLAVAGPKLIIINTQDQESLDALRQLYPHSALSLHKSDVEGHDFYILFIPGE